MPEPVLMRAFRFRVALLRSGPGVSGGGAAAGAGAVASAGVSASASAGIGGFAMAGASASATASASASASVGAGASAGVGVGIGAGVSLSASAGLGFGAAAGGARLGDGGFAECSGLDLELDVQELQEGGRNDGLIRRVGHARYQSIVLHRGMFHGRGGQANADLWRWLQDVAAGVRPVRRYDGLIEVMDRAEDVVARWSFSRGLPAKVTGPRLDARTGELAIEELHIAHEGLRLVSG